MRNLLAVAAVALLGCFQLTSCAREITVRGGELRGRVGEIAASFPALDVERVVLRALEADSARVLTHKESVIRVSGIAKGTVEENYLAGRDEEAASPSEWGMAFVGRQVAGDYILSTFGEFRLFMHDYRFEDIRVSVPLGVSVVLRNTEFQGQRIYDIRDDDGPLSDASADPTDEK